MKVARTLEETVTKWLALALAFALCVWPVACGPGNSVARVLNLDTRASKLNCHNTGVS